MDIGCTLGITATALGLTAMFYGYKLKADKKSIILEKKEQQAEERIKELEKKNGAEQHQIDELKKKVEQLEKKLN